MPDHFSLKLRIKSVVMFPVRLLLIFELQSNLVCFLTPASFHRHISICGVIKNYAINPNSPEGWSMRPLESFSHYRSYIS